MKVKLLIYLAILLLVLVSPKFFSGAVFADDCGGPIPPKPEGVTAVSGPGTGEITLHWNGAPHANRYAVAYGMASNNYIYGANNIGDETARSYTIKYLRRGVRYYIRLAAAHDCSSSPFSGEVSVVTKGEVEKATVAVKTSVEVKKEVKTQAVVTEEVVQSVAKPVSKQKLWGKPGPKVGEVTLYWQNVDSAEDYHLVYGTERGKFKYGALNIGKPSQFTVRFLSPGVTYYFALVPLVSNIPLYTTDQLMVKAKIDVQTVNMDTIPPSVPVQQPKAQEKVEVTPSVAPTTAPSAPIEE